MNCYFCMRVLGLALISLLISFSFTLSYFGLSPIVLLKNLSDAKGAVKENGSCLGEISQLSLQNSL